LNQCASAQNCSEKFDANFWAKNLRVEIAGDFPNCDSCYLKIVDKRTGLENKQFRISHFFSEYYKGREYLFSVPHTDSKFNEFDVAQLDKMHSGYFLRIIDIYVVCIKCKECVVTLKPISETIWPTK